MLASLTSWLTPSSLFVILNIVIGTIVIISRFTSSRQPQYHHHQPGHGYSAPSLARVPSFLERVKSIDFSFSKYGHPNHHEALFVNPSESQYTAPPQLERVPSILERVRSTDFIQRFVHPTESECTAMPPLERTPSFLERVKSINFSFSKFAPSYPESDYVSHVDPPYEAPQPDSPKLSRTPSLLERVKSIDFTSFYRSDFIKANPETEFPPAPESDSGTDMIRDHGQVNRSKSERTMTKRSSPEKMKKSVSENSRLKEDDEEVERRRSDTARIEKTVSIKESGDVDAKADDFINRFKQQLKLQRLDSLLRYKEMLKGK